MDRISESSKNWKQKKSKYCMCRANYACVSLLCQSAKWFAWGALTNNWLCDATGGDRRWPTAANKRKMPACIHRYPVRAHSFPLILHYRLLFAEADNCLLIVFKFAACRQPLFSPSCLFRWLLPRHLYDERRKCALLTQAAPLCLFAIAIARTLRARALHPNNSRINMMTDSFSIGTFDTLADIYWTNVKWVDAVKLHCSRRDAIVVSFAHRPARARLLPQIHGINNAQWTGCSSLNLLWTWRFNNNGHLCRHSSHSAQPH